MSAQDQGPSLRPFTRERLLNLYECLYATYGPQHWWPAETTFEVVIGAVLTQNTAWTNVERAIAGLRERDLMTPEAIMAVEPVTLANCLRPSGYFNIKTARLKNVAAWILSQGGMSALECIGTPDLRRELLAVNGIGPETADDILLYALHRPVFVIDTYTRRLLSRLNLARGDEPYETLRGGFEAHLPVSVPLYNEYHALIVRHAKERCSKTPGCGHCRVEMPDANR